MAETKVESTAVVTLTLEVRLTDTWGDNCFLSEVYERAEQEAVRKIEVALKGEPVTIVGRPVVKAVLATKARP